MGIIIKDGKRYKKVLVTQDSWGLDKTTNKGLRYITESYLKARMIFAAYVYDLSNTWRDKTEEDKPNKPKYTFNNILKYGDQNEDILNLQKILKYFGFFPLNTECTGKYFSITAKAVLEWQKKYNIDNIQELDNLGGKIFGPKSISKMNELLV